jgi:hypothetical protein
LTCSEFFVIGRIHYNTCAARNGDGNQCGVEKLIMWLINKKMQAMMMDFKT